MRLHTNTLTASDAFAAAYGTLASYYYGGNLPTDLTIGTGLLKLPGVSADAMAHGSRSHTRSLEVKLTGTSTRRPNPGTGPRDGSDDYAATWDEWGMFLNRLYAADPAMVCGTVKRPIYANREHFRWVTAGRYDTLTPDAQHRNHKWEYSGEAVTGAFMVHECSGGKSPCGATRRFANSSAWLADNGMTAGA